VSRRELSRRRSLAGLTEEQVEIVRAAVTEALIGRAADLRLLNKLRDPKRAVREVAALARLVRGLGEGEIAVPDRVAWEVMARMSKELLQMDEELIESYEQAIAEHRAMRAFVACFEGAGSDG
jgi:hypothetical protein